MHDSDTYVPAGHTLSSHATGVREYVGVAENDGEKLLVAEYDGESLLVADGERVLLCENDGVTVGDVVNVPVGENVCVAVTDADTDGDGDGVATTMPTLVTTACPVELTEQPAGSASVNDTVEVSAGHCCKATDTLYDSDSVGRVAGAHCRTGTRPATVAVPAGTITAGSLMVRTTHAYGRAPHGSVALTVITVPPTPRYWALVTRWVIVGARLAMVR